MSAAVASALPMSSATAASPPVQVAEVAIEGAVPPVWNERIHARLVAGFREAGIDTHATDTDAAHRAMTARLEVTANGRDFALQLVMLDSQTDAPVATIVDVCDTCGFSELAERVEAMTVSAVRALEKAEPRPASVTMRSDPAGATVVLDGTALGSTPLQTPIPAGEHTLIMRVDGHLPHRREILVAEGEVVAYDVTLTADTVVRPKRERILRGVAAGGVGVGLVSIAAGGTLIWLHGRPLRRDCAAGNVDADGHCRFLHDTRAAGIAVTVLGSAAAIAGATVLGLVSTKRQPRSGVAVVPTSRGLQVRF